MCEHLLVHVQTCRPNSGVTDSDFLCASAGGHLDVPLQGSTSWLTDSPLWHGSTPSGSGTVTWVIEIGRPQGRSKYLSPDIFHLMKGLDVAAALPPLNPRERKHPASSLWPDQKSPLCHCTAPSLFCSVGRASKASPLVSWETRKAIQELQLQKRKELEDQDEERQGCHISLVHSRRAT